MTAPTPSWGDLAGAVRVDGIPPHRVLGTMVRSGLLSPWPGGHRALAQLDALRQWGFGLAGELRQAARRAPDRVAVIDERRGAVTYRQLVDRARRIATVLDAAGIGESSRVGLLARNHVGAVEVMAAVGHLGADVVLLNTGLAGQVLVTVADQQRLDLVVHDDDLTGLMSDVDLPRLSETELAHRVAEAHPLPEVPPARVGRVIVLTSGTTGVPKGAARRTPGGFGPLVSMVDRIPLRVGDTILISAPLFHTWGYAALQLAIGLRATIVLHRRFDALAARAALAEHRCDAMFPVPVMLQRMLDLGPDPRRAQRSRLRVVATSGSALPGGFASRFMDEYGEVLYSLYGSTEASWVCIATPADLRRDPATAGTPPLGTRVRIVDGEGSPVPEGVTGRIFAGNELVFEGYVGGEQRESLDGLVATGDLGHLAGGLYYVDGREDDMVVSGGENVYPAEVETVLTAHLPVREVAVVGVPDPEFGQRLAAYLVIEPGAQVTADGVRALVHDRLARHCVPRDVVFVDRLPRNATGKVLHRELRETAAPE